MTEVKMYKAIDGKIFETADECIKHNKAIEIFSEVNSAIETLQDFCQTQECEIHVFRNGRCCRLDSLFEIGYI